MAATKQSGPISVEGVLAGLRKDYGPAAVMLMSDQPQDIPVISTSSIGLDQALGIGGLPRGRITEVFGPASSGKTTIVLHAVGNAQRAGGTAAFIDAENALTEDLVRACGGNTETLLISQPGSGEEGLEICARFAASGSVDIIVVDSVAALVPQAEIEGDLGESHGMGLQARMMAQAMRKINGALSGNNRTAVVFINQLREKPGVTFGNPEYQPGGKSLPFYASIRLDVRAIERLKRGTNPDPYGNKVRIKVVKNKCAAPFRQAEFQVIFGGGINRWAELVELGAQYGVVQRSGAWYGFNGQSLGQGIDGAAGALYQQPDVCNSIYAALQVAMTGARVVPGVSQSAASFNGDQPSLQQPVLVPDEPQDDEAAQGGGPHA